MASAGQWRDDLAAHPYGFNAGDFVRFCADTNDDAVGSVVRSVATSGWDDCYGFRRSLGEADVEILRTYALRRIVQGRRQASLSALYEAFDAFALLPRVNDVPWESWFKGDLLVARSLGGDFASFADRFADLADEHAVARSDVAIESMSRVDSLAQCHLVEVSTSYGTGIVETLVFRDTSPTGLFGTFRLRDNVVEFAPTTNVAQLAASLADGLDATRRVITGPIGQDQLAGTLFSLVVAGAYLPCAGCLSFVADGLHGASSFTAFVAELLDESDVASLAASANDTEGEAAFYDGQRIVVLSAQPSFDEGDEGGVEVDPHEFDRSVRSSFGSPATADWRPR